MDKFEIKTAFNRVKYDKKFDPGNMANVNDILCANPMQGVMEQIQDVIHESDLAHDNFIKECIVSVGIDPNALTETAKLNAKLQYELKTLRAEVAKLQEVNADLNESLRLAAEANKDLRAVVDRLRFNLKAVLDERAEDKAEVAREIFEEIERFLKNQEAISENKRLKEVGDWIFHDYLPTQLAELKEKYTEETQHGRTETD